MTPAAQLIEHKLGRSLIAYLAAQQKQGKSWRQIAEQVKADTGVSISHESLRTWAKSPARTNRQGGLTMRARKSA